MIRLTRKRYWASLLLVTLPIAGVAETPVESNVDSRLTLAFQARDAELQTWLPAPWVVSQVPAGPSKGANLFLVFLQQLISEGADGKPSSFGATGRAVVVAISGKHGQTGEPAVFVARIYTTSDAGVPGPYKNSVRAAVRRELVLKGDNQEPGTSTDTWELRDAAGGTMLVRMAYQRSLPVRSKVEQKPRSAAEPDFFRIYRVDQGTEVVKSIPSGIDQVQSYEFKSSVQELAKILAVETQLISITAVPWYVRQVSLP